MGGGGGGGGGGAGEIAVAVVWRSSSGSTSRSCSCSSSFNTRNSTSSVPVHQQAYHKASHSSTALCDRLPLGHRHVGAEYEGVRLVHEASEARAALSMGRLGVKGSGILGLRLQEIGVSGAGAEGFVAYTIFYLERQP